MCRRQVLASVWHSFDLNNIGFTLCAVRWRENSDKSFHKFIRMNKVFGKLLTSITQDFPICAVGKKFVKVGEIIRGRRQLLANVWHTFDLNNIRFPPISGFTYRCPLLFWDLVNNNQYTKILNSMKVKQKCWVYTTDAPPF